MSQEKPTVKTAVSLLVGLVAVVFVVGSVFGWSIAFLVMVR